MVAEGEPSSVGVEPTGIESGGGKGTVAVTLNAPPALEERLVDWLLEREVPGFTRYAAHGHSSRPGQRLTIAEQVSGRRRRVEFRVELDAANVEHFLTELRAVIRNADVYYFVTPLLASGHLGGTGND